MEAICNHKEAIQNWSDDITPLCTCAVLKQFPSARAFPNLKGEHWVLDGALLAPFLPDRLAQIVGGSLNNKNFPNKKELQRLTSAVQRTPQGEATSREIPVDRDEDLDVPAAGS